MSDPGEEKEGGSPTPSRKSVSLPGSPEPKRSNPIEVGSLKRTKSLLYIQYLPYYLAEKMSSGSRDRANARLTDALRIPEDGKVPCHRPETDSWPGDVIRSANAPRSHNANSFVRTNNLIDPDCDSMQWVCFTNNAHKKEIVVLWKYDESKGSYKRKRILIEKDHFLQEIRPRYVVDAQGTISSGPEMSGSDSIGAVALPSGDTSDLERMLEDIPTPELQECDTEIDEPISPIISSSSRSATEVARELLFKRSKSLEDVPEDFLGEENSRETYNQLLREEELKSRLDRKPLEEKLTRKNRQLQKELNEAEEKLS